MVTFSSTIPMMLKQRIARPPKCIVLSSRRSSELDPSMRLHPSVPILRGAAGWLGAPTTWRTNAIVMLTGTGLVIACWALAGVPNLVLAPRTFLVLFSVAWLAYACGALVTARLRSPVMIVVVLAVGVL